MWQRGFLEGLGLGRAALKNTSECGGAAIGTVVNLVMNLATATCEPLISRGHGRGKLSMY